MEQIIFSDQVVTSAAELNSLRGLAGGEVSQRTGRGPREGASALQHATT
jgi:hypothetical protein